jgi:glycine cleavage system P protein (glycine dehydrogenase) subunit 1
MPFNPHTESDVTTMLEAIGAPDIAALFDEIPESLLIDELSGVPPRVSEMEITRLMHARAAQDGTLLNFIGAGAYEHHIPAAVWEITTRGEFYTAYTPYQAEASQGTLQLIYEFQTMMTGLTGLDVSNASLYDGASALAEAALMAVRCQRKDSSRRILVLGTVNPLYRRVMQAIAGPQDISFEAVPFCEQTGSVLPDVMDAHAGDGFTALVVQHPNFFGGMEAVDALTDWAHSKGALLIASTNPTALALLKPPGEWGQGGADIACGEGQPLGVPLSSGGPYFGFMTCKQALVRQMPGRIVGRTVDLEGREGFTLTLQAREQHIRRSKATSNICTNQGLMVTAATIHMALLGHEGLRRVAATSHANTRRLVEVLTSISGVERVFSGPVFHEDVLRLERPVGPVLEALADRGIIGGYAMNDHFPELGEALLVCATETRTEADIQAYATALDRILSA